MGQGLHTKIAQIAASSFSIPLSSVFISETSTDKVYHIFAGLKRIYLSCSDFVTIKNLFIIFDLLNHQVPNASPTAASASSDLYGQAVLNACEEIKSRMKPVAEKGTFSSVAKLASA